MEVCAEFITCETGSDPGAGDSEGEAALAAGSGSESGAATAGRRARGAAAVGRLVDSSQADDRKMIRLVRERPLLYARNNMPVASYYNSVKSLWLDVANEMGWTVAEVRRKWSHIRNSYSRHLRNEMYGVRTGRGRMVSRWYLADELDFLREHMATDTRASPYSGKCGSVRKRESPDTLRAEAVDLKPFDGPWPPAAAAAVKAEPGGADDSCSSNAFSADENSSYFQFFRGIHQDYLGLSEKKQRFFRRQCLNVLHDLLDEEDAPATLYQNCAINLSNSAHESDEDKNGGVHIVETYSIFP